MWYGISALRTFEQYALFGVLFIAVLGLLYALFLRKQVISEDAGTPEMLKVWGAIKEGANAYLKRQLKTILPLIGLLTVCLFLSVYIVPVSQDSMERFAGLSPEKVKLIAAFGRAGAFILGAVFSLLVGQLGMRIAVDANVRVAAASKRSFGDALRIAYRAGTVTGMLTDGLGLLGGTLIFIIFGIAAPDALLGFGFGGTLLALFMRVGGGIYTKAADVGADLVGKVEAGIPEDDPRNPATIADNVGDNVGDVAGMGADLYESYCGSILATAALGAAVAAQSAGATTDYALKLVLSPMIVAGLGTLLSLIGIRMVSCREGASQKQLLRSLLTGTLGSSVLILVALLFLWYLDFITLGIFGSVVAGLAAGVIIGQATEYYTSAEYKPTRGIAFQAQMGPATTIIDGLATGMYSAGIPVVTIVIGILCAYGFAGGFSGAPGAFSMGLYGVGFAAVGMLSTLGITLATDAYGPIADNAGGNAEMSGLPPEVRQRTDALDSLGNTTAATGKGFAIGSAALTAMALLASFIEESKIWIGKFDSGLGEGIDVAAASKMTILNFVDWQQLNIMNPMLLGGLFIGGMAAFLFCAMTMKAVGRAAGSMVEEVRRQFQAMPGIMKGEEKPDYARCVAISTAGAQREMLVPSLLAIVIPVLTGLILGIPGVMGMLAGGLATGFVLATMLNNAGGAWDNAKKHIENGAYGGKKLADGSKNPTHAAAVIGDTVGDPCKDTSGPALNILIKLMSMVCIVFAPVFIKFSPMIQSWLGIAGKLQ